MIWTFGKDADGGTSIAEVSPASERGMLMSGYQTVLQVCALIGFWGAFASHAVFPSTSEWQWEIPVVIQFVPGVLLFLCTFLVPETPRFLAECGKYDAAEKSLAWLRGLPMGDAALEQELDDIREAAKVSQSFKEDKESFFKEAMTKSVRQRLFVGAGLMIAQNMVGLNALNYCKGSLLSLRGGNSAY